MAKRKVNPLYLTWGDRIREADEAERLKTWESARTVFDAVKEIFEKTNDELRLIQKRLARQSGVSLYRIYTRYETIARMRGTFGLGAIESQPHSYYTTVQHVAMTHNLTVEDKVEFIRQMDTDDNGADSKTSYAEAVHYCKEKGKQRAHKSSAGNSSPSPASDLDSPTKIADALASVLDRIRRAPAAVRSLEEWAAVKTLVAKLRAMAEGEE